MPTIDHIITGECYFKAGHIVLCISRTRDDSHPITLDEWRRYIDLDDELEPDEIFDQHNIDRGTDEIWQELGRAKWTPEHYQPDHFHFSPRRVWHYFNRQLPPLFITEKFYRIYDKIGQNPTFEQWIDWVQHDPYLVLASDYAGTIPAGYEALIGRAFWLSRKGDIKHVFDYLPAHIWLSKKARCYYTDEYVSADPHRLTKCRQIAQSLAAHVFEGQATIS